MAALVFCDGFDKYGPPGNVNVTSVLSGDWSVTGTSIALVAPLSALGAAINLSATNTGLVTTLPSTMTRIVGSMRISLPATGGGPIRFYNGGSVTCMLFFQTTPSPAVSLYTGNIATLITSGGAIALNTVFSVSWDITFGAAAAYAVYMNGVLLFSGTGNTGGGFTSINAVAIGFCSLLGNIIYDDLALFDPVDSHYNSGVLTSSPVVETSFPNNDVQTQFANNGNLLWPTGIAANGIYQGISTTFTGSMIANSLDLFKITPVVNCTLNSISVLSHTAVPAVKARAVVYSDSAGSPNALLSSGTEIIGTAAGVVLTGFLVTPQSLIAGTSYWIGFINDTTISTRLYDNTTNLGRRIGNTYTSGAPGTAGAMTTGITTWLMWGNCTGASENFGSVLLNPPYGTSQSQISSSTVGQEDLYEFPALISVPTVIYGASVKGYINKSDSGARTVSFNMKSGLSDATGSAPGQTVSPTIQWQRSQFDTDPATGLAWTLSGLNNAKSGISVAS